MFASDRHAKVSVLETRDWQLGAVANAIKAPCISLGSSSTEFKVVRSDFLWLGKFLQMSPEFYSKTS